MTDRECEIAAEIERLQNNRGVITYQRDRLESLYAQRRDQIRALQGQLMEIRSEESHGMVVKIDDPIWGTEELRAHFRSGYENSLNPAPAFCGRVAYVGSIYGDDMCFIHSAPSGSGRSGIGGIPLSIIIGCRVAYLERQNA